MTGSYDIPPPPGQPGQKHFSPRLRESRAPNDHYQAAPLTADHYSGNSSNPGGLDQRAGDCRPPARRPAASRIHWPSTSRRPGVGVGRLGDEIDHLVAGRGAEADHDLRCREPPSGALGRGVPLRHRVPPPAEAPPAASPSHPRAHEPGTARRDRWRPCAGRELERLARRPPRSPPRAAPSSRRDERSLPEPAGSRPPARPRQAQIVSWGEDQLFLGAHIGEHRLHRDVGGISDPRDRHVLNPRSANVRSAVAKIASLVSRFFRARSPSGSGPVAGCGPGGVDGGIR